MTDIPFPPESAGLTADDIPYGYSMYRSIWDDKRGYARKAVGSSLDENGRLVIMVALSPGQYVPATMVSAGWAPDQAEDTLLGMITEVVTAEPGPVPLPSTGSARALREQGPEKETGE
jgi:hypothetical protein